MKALRVLVFTSIQLKKKLSVVSTILKSFFNFTKLTTGLNSKQLFTLVKTARSLAKEKSIQQPREEEFIVAFYLLDDLNITHQFRSNNMCKKNQIDFISRYIF